MPPKNSNQTTNQSAPNTGGSQPQQDAPSTGQGPNNKKSYYKPKGAAPNSSDPSDSPQKQMPQNSTYGQERKETDRQTNQQQYQKDYYGQRPNTGRGGYPDSGGRGGRGGYQNRGGGGNQNNYYQNNNNNNQNARGNNNPNQQRRGGGDYNKNPNDRGYQQKMGNNQNNYQNQMMNPMMMNNMMMMSGMAASGMQNTGQANTPQMHAHMENIQNLDKSELEGLFMTVIQQCGGDILPQGILPQGESGAQMSFKDIVGHLKKASQSEGFGMQNNQGNNYQGGKRKNQQYQGNQGGQGMNQGFNQPGANPGFKDNSANNNMYGGGNNKQGQNQYKQNKNVNPKVYQPKSAQESSNLLSAALPDVDEDALKFRPPPQPSPSVVMTDLPNNSAQTAQPDDEESKSSLSAGGMVVGGQNQVSRNLCEEHFPQPIIMYLDRPLCKKCIPEYISKQLRAAGSQQQQAKAINARMLGMNSMALNAYSSEKSQISKSIERLNNFKSDFRYLQEEISDREKASHEYLTELPPVMNEMFDKLDELVGQSEQRFKNKIFQIVRNQQRNIQEDIKTKLPQFYQRLEQKYQQLQMASNIAQQRGMEELVETLEHYQKIFVDLDAEYEKYFNDYEKMSKLQRLLDKDPNEILSDFKDLVETNLRVDYNIKSSFGTQLPQRLHSFQWNQRCSQIYRIKTNTFEKKQVQMQYEVPLYSRSIATENGTIYLTGGYIKHMNVYLKSCHRYDEIFGNLVAVSSMNYPHADHSVCAIQGFLYVVGTFVNNKVYGQCEQYDTQKDKWKVIDEMRVPRTGVSLCAFKNNYMFAFGGRVDQKKIVDTIECYDISRNVWQEIPTALCDKTKWVPAYMGLAHQITDKEILLFGGKSALTFQIFNGCFVFDVEKMQIREQGSLVNPCSFMNTPLVFNSCLYAYGNDIYVHKYDVPEQKWSVIPKTSVVLPRS